MSEERDLKAKVQSVSARLKTLARQAGIDYNVLFTRYLNECFLARLARSPYAENLILKGGMSLWLVPGLPYARPTQDIDFLGRGVANQPETCRAMIGAIAAIALDDGIEFDVAAAQVEAITLEEQYPGVRVTVPVRFGGIPQNFKLKVDIGFGDAAVPQPEMTVFPGLLDPPGAQGGLRVRMYAFETIVAEKFEALVSLGQFNSRAKDVYDLYTICSSRDFDGTRLTEALRGTFARRKTLLISDPLAFHPEYLVDGTKQQQWAACLRNHRLEAIAPAALADALARVRLFLAPPVEALIRGDPWPRRWTCGALAWLEA